MTRKPVRKMPTEPEPEPHRHGAIRYDAAIQIHLHASKDMVAALRTTADALDISIAEVVRRALEPFLDVSAEAPFPTKRKKGTAA